MNPGKLLVIFAVISVLAPVARAEVPLASPEQERRVKEATPPGGKALIYLFRGDTAGDAPELPVWMNGRFVGNTAPGTFFVWAAQAGRYVIAGTQDGREGLVLPIESGRNYFVQQDMRPGEPGQSRFGQVSLATGRYAVIGRRLIDAALAARMPVKAPPAPSMAKEFVPPPDLPPVAREQTEPKAAQTPPKPKVEVPPVAKPEDKPPAAAETFDRPAGHLPWSVRFRTGGFALSKKSQTLVGIPVGFDSGASGVVDVEVEFRRPDGLAFGVELLRYSNDLTATGSSNQSRVDVSAIMATVKKYLPAGRGLYPFIGAGIGTSGADFSGRVVEGSTAGVATQLMAGVEYRFERAVLMLDYRSLSARTEDGDGNEADVGGSGFLAGVGLRF